MATKSKIVIFHNPRCSKSREALAILNENNCEIEIVEYLKNKPTVKQLKDILQKLGLQPFDLVRKKEELFLTKFKNKKFTDAEWLQLLVENPVLIERPIVIDGYKAVIGRPPSLVVDLLKRKRM